jgi:hypothetical protein
MPTQSETDLRILAEMADEIEKYGWCQLPGSLRSLVRTSRGKAVGMLLENLSHKLMFSQFARGEEPSKLNKEIDGLRNEMQTLTDLVTPNNGDPFKD